MGLILLLVEVAPEKTEELLYLAQLVLLVVAFRRLLHLVACRVEAVRNQVSPWHSAPYSKEARLS